MPADDPFPARIVSDRSWHRRRLWAGAVLAVLVAVGACSPGSSSNDRAQRDQAPAASPDQDRTGPGQPVATTLANLTGLDELEGLFDKHQGVPRLILLLSPT